MSKHTTSAKTWPEFPPPPAFPVTKAVAFQPFSVTNGSKNLISADPKILKLPLKAVSPGSHVAVEVMIGFAPPANVPLTSGPKFV